jgi:hypothetical protein
MADKFASYSDAVSAPAREVFLITPHATNEVSPLPKAIRADSAGTVTLRAIDSAADVTMTMAAGEVLDIRARYVRVTGTTVATLHGLA